MHNKRDFLHLANYFIAFLLISENLLFSFAETQSKPEMIYLEYYLAKQQAQNYEKQHDYENAFTNYNKAREHLEKIKLIDPEWRPAFINVKLSECSSSISLMSYYILFNKAVNLQKQEKLDEALSTLKIARQSLDLAKLDSPPWRESQILEEIKKSDKLIGQLSLINNENVQGANNLSNLNNDIQDFLPTVALPEGLAPLPRAIAPIENNSFDLDKKIEQDDADQLLTEAKSNISKLTLEKSELQKQLQDADEKHRQIVLELQNKSKELGRQLAETNQKLIESREELRKIKQMKLQETVEQLTKELDDARLALRETNQKIIEYDTEKAILKKRLTDLEKQLEEQNISNELIKKKEREKELVNEIINKIREEQNVKLEARKKALDIIEKLEIESEELITQIDILSRGPTLNSIETTELLKNDSSSEITQQKLTSDNTGSSDLHSADFADKSKFSLKATKLADEADQLYSQGNLVEAARKYEKILDIHPDSVYALSNYGVICHQLGKHRTAQALFERAVQIAPDDSFSLTMLGVIYCLLGVENNTYYQKAFEILSKASRIDPNNAMIRNYLGITAFNLNRPEIAERELRRAIELRNDYSVAHINLAVIYANQSPPAMEMARRHYIRAIELGHERHPQTEAKIRISESDLPRRPLTSIR